MHDAWIFHYSSELAGSTQEYIVIVEEEDMEPEEHLLNGFKFVRKQHVRYHPSSGFSKLPLDRVLMTEF